MNRRAFLRGLAGLATVACVAPGALLGPSAPVVHVLTEAEKRAIIIDILNNAIEAHDRLIEEAIFRYTLTGEPLCYSSMIEPGLASLSDLSGTLGSRLKRPAWITATWPGKAEEPEASQS